MLDIFYQNRVVMEKDLYSCGLPATVDDTLIPATVTDTQTAFLHCQYPVPRKEGKSHFSVKTLFAFDFIS